MRIVIDLQGAQSETSGQRGIGRYSLAIAKAIVCKRGEHDVFIVLNGMSPETIEPIRAEFNQLLPQENIRVWFAEKPVKQLDEKNSWRRQAAELLREAFILSLKPDVILITSLFEGIDDNTATSIGRLVSCIPTAVILYDLIPFIYRSVYLQNPIVEVWYENKIDHLRRADLLLAISESTRRDGIKYLDLVEDSVVNISAAICTNFKVLKLDKKDKDIIKKRYGLYTPFIMYTGGIDYRKNIEGLICAYARLPAELRSQHQLVIVCSVQSDDIIRLKRLAKENNIPNEQLVLTGFVPDEDLLMLYNLCKIFVFPSWHEGFGLPILEAMSCGRAVIGANTSSVPEIIGRNDVLFDPMNVGSIAEKIEQVLTNEEFRSELEQHALVRAKTFSWDKSANLAIKALEVLYTKKQQKFSGTSFYKRPKLAYVSPVLPERSGISSYSAVILPELSKFYDIDVIVVQDKVTDVWVLANCNVRNVEWLLHNRDIYDRVLYQLGNSSFHKHMLGLIKKVPGVVVLHDFFLSSLVHVVNPSVWVTELYKSHGYSAIRDCCLASDITDVILKYPCNISVLQQAYGIIVHSEFSKQLAKRWYGGEDFKNWDVIPQARTQCHGFSRAKSRHLLNIKEDEFVLCSFGVLGRTKINHRLLDAWLHSSLRKNEKCKLVFVGLNHGGEYGAQLVRTIKKNKCAKSIRITGWVGDTTFEHYLAAADIAVQLRTLSQGETSAAVLCCMSYGIPTIINAHGSMRDLPGDAVWKISDKFSDAELIEALEILWTNKTICRKLSENARKWVRVQHSPRICAEQCFNAIEKTYCFSATNYPALARMLVKLEPKPAAPEAWMFLADSIAKSVAQPFTQRQLFIDVSVLVQRDAKSGIQRVVKNVLRELLINPPDAWRVEPIYATMQENYRYACQFSLDFLGCKVGAINDELVEYRSGDVFLGLDLHPLVVPSKQKYFQHMRNSGVKIFFVVYDLLPILMPQFFAEKDSVNFRNWLDVVTQCDGAICISKAVAEELAVWMEDKGSKRYRPFKIDWFHLGADIESAGHGENVLKGCDEMLNKIKNKLSFLMVGTLEPRKGYLQVLKAFEALWAKGVEVNLVIVGRQGWMMENLIERLRNHSKLGKHLFWQESINDECLNKIYAASSCLIAASEGEGFGLPLIEAAKHRLPIIARDIPVFREVAGEYALYFQGVGSDQLEQTIQKWLSLSKQNKAPSIEDMLWLTWKESVKQLLSKLTNEI